MKSIKPGRGPSFIGGVSSVIVGILGVVWIVSASSMGAPDVFTLFGLGFVVLAIVSAVYQFRNAAGKNRFSVYDITSEKEESDPFNQLLGGEKPEPAEDEPEGDAPAFCPYCGERAAEAYRFCPKCGKELP